MFKQPVDQSPQQEQGFLCNNMIHNPALMNNLQGIFVITLCCLCTSTAIFITEYGPNGFVLVSLPGMVTSALVLPSLLYCFKS